MNKKPGDAEPGAQPCPSADYLRSYPIDPSPLLGRGWPEIHVIKPGEIEKFAGQGGMEDVRAKSGEIKLIERNFDSRRSGRPDFRGPVLQAAERRINAGNFDTSLIKFAKEIVDEDFPNSLPEDRPAVRTVVRIIRESDQWARWHHLFRTRRKRL
jgi:hypothetical protein